MGIPSIHLGGREWTFKMKSAASMGDTWGCCYYDKARLEIAKGQLPIDEADSALHETMHAILFTQGRPYAGEEEERYVTALSTGLVATLRDNPDFAAWLFERIQT